MDKVTFNLNSIEINVGTRPVSVRHSIEIFTEEQKRKFTYFQDWLNVESMYHYYDRRFYVDRESAKNWTLDISKDEQGNNKKVDILTPGIEKSEVLNVYLIKIFNPFTNTFDEVECLPFTNLYKLLKVNILIPVQN